MDKGDKKYYSSTVHPRNVYRDGKSPILFERDESGKFLILKDQAQDIFVLQKVLEAHGFKVDLKEVP